MRIGGAAFVLWAGLMSAGAAFGHGGASGIVKERMDVMSEISRNMKSIGTMLKGGSALNPDLVIDAGDAIAAHAGDRLTALFPEGSDHAPTEASPEIWKKWPAFSASAENMKAAALALKKVAEAGEGKKEIAGAFGKLAATCKSCHEVFRIKK